MVGYVPALFYANLFTMFFLEIKERTKGGKNKDKEDKKIGTGVIFFIFAFYLMLYVPFCVAAFIEGKGAK